MGHTQPPIQWLSRVKQPGREISHLHLVPRLEMFGGIPPLLLHACMAWTGTTLPLFFLCFRVSVFSGPETCTMAVCVYSM